MSVTSVRGALLCSHWDCCSPAQRIELGVTPEKTNKFYNPAGELVREITFPAEPVTISSVIREVISYENWLCRLACGHTRAPLPLISAQEYFITPGGETIKGEGVASFRTAK